MTTPCLPQPMHLLVAGAIADLCARFEHGGYNPSCVIDLGVLVARADGAVDDKERAALRDVFETLLEERLSPAVVDHLIGASLEVIEAAGVEPRARLVAEILDDCDAVEQGIVVALAVALSSDGLASAERAVIAQIARAARFPMARVEALIARVREVAPEALAVPPSRRGGATPG
jgi:tellurite resistance protein